MKKTTRPLERVYLTAFGNDTVDDGVIYTFIALDDFSEVLFMLGVEKALNEQAVLNNVINLVNKEDFYQRLTDKFTLVLPFGNTIEDTIDTVISTYNGNVIFDEKLVSKKFKPVFKAFEGF